MIIEKFRNYLSIAHHIPGRIRIKVSLSILQSDDLSLLKEFSSTFKNFEISSPSIFSVRINKLSRSCVIEYDKSMIPFDAWQSLLDGEKNNDSDILLSEMKKIAGSDLENKL